jgi:hypothetical protein
VNPVNLEGVLVFRELLQIALGEFALDIGLVGRIYQSDTGSLEAGTTETTAIDSGEGAHNLIDSNELGGATLVVMDTTLATIEREFSEKLEVTRFPSGDTLTHTTVF